METTKKLKRAGATINGLEWTLVHQRFLQDVQVHVDFGRDYGDVFDRAFDVLPKLLNADDERSAVEQLIAHKLWQDFVGFKLAHSGNGFSLVYATDPPLLEVGRTKLRDELVVAFEGKWVVVVATDQLNNADSKLHKRVSRITTEKLDV